MNIKSLLLGSAAAFVAVSGARAADAVVIAEPEPMEYVRICDTYGVGFFYIPGTETCLKISGYIRYDIGVGISGLQDVLDRHEFWDNDGNRETDDTYYKRARITLRTDSRTETELGTLRTFAELRFNYDTNTFTTQGGDTSTTVNYNWDFDQAYIELGGFRIGETDSLFSTFTGYSSGVNNDGLVPYGPFNTHQIAYNWVGGNGFRASVAVEEGNGNAISPQYDGTVYTDLYTLDSYVPNVVGGVGWTQGWGGIAVVAGYDSVNEEGAIKGRVDFNAGDALSLFVMAGWASVDDDWADQWSGPGSNPGADGDSPNYYAPWGGDWAVWVGGAWKVSEKATINFEIGYDEQEDFSAVADVAYEIVPNFSIIPEIIYVDNFNDDLDDDNDSDNIGGFVRFQANWGG